MTDVYMDKINGSIRPKNENDSIVPYITGQGAPTLGTSGNPWNKAWLGALDVSGIGHFGSLDVEGEIAGGSLNLGDGSINAGPVTANGLVSCVDVSATEDISGRDLIASRNLTVTDSVLSTLKPGTDLASSLGTSDRKWNKAWLGAVEVKSGGNGNVLLSADSANAAVGIGTNTPSKGKLEVVGSIAVAGNGNELKLYYGSYYIGLKAPSSLAANKDYTLPSLDGLSGQVLATNGGGVLSFVDRVSGPASATDNAIARFDTTGKVIQNSGVTISDDNDVTGVRSLAISSDLLVYGYVRFDLKGTPTSNLGDAGNRWESAFLKGLDVSAASNVSIIGNDAASRTITLGQKSTHTDVVNIGGEFGTSLVPNTVGPALGSGGVSAKRWANAFLGGLDVSVGDLPVSIVGDGDASRTITLGRRVGPIVDVVNIGGELGASLVPNNPALSLGSTGVPSKRWANAYLAGLDVAGSVGITGAVGITGGATVTLNSTADKFSVRAHANQAIQPFEVADSNGTAKVVVDENFYVGVGTANPLVPLDVYKSGTVWGNVPDSAVAAFSNTGYSGNSATVFVLSGASGEASLHLGNYAVPSRGTISFDNGSGVMSFGLYGSTAFKFNPLKADVDFVVSGDNIDDLVHVVGNPDAVGIGLADPSALLHVKGVSASQKQLVVQAHSSQSVNVLDIQDSGGTSKVSVDSSFNVNCAEYVNVGAGKGYKVNGTKVVGTQQSAISGVTETGTDADGAARAAINSILAALRAHGLIASA